MRFKVRNIMKRSEVRVKSLLYHYQYINLLILRQVPAVILALFSFLFISFSAYTVVAKLDGVSIRGYIAFLNAETGTITLQ